MIVRGLGAQANQTTGEIISGVSTAGAAVGVAASAGLLATIGITAAAVPIIGPIVAGVTLLIGALGVGAGCGQSCIASTKIVNAVEPYMQQNVAAAKQQAQANGGWLTPDEQSALVANFNALWQEVVQQCGAVGGPGGSNCVKDRQRGGKWDWFGYYLDPITSIPVQTPSVTGEAGSAVSSLANRLGLGSNLPLLAVGALVMVLVIVEANSGSKH